MSEFGDDASEYIGQLELGRSMFELIEFTIRRRLRDGRKITGTYGVNVAKVREVVRMPEINPLSSRIPGIAGIFELRGIPIPAVNLARALGDKDAPIGADQQIIVTEFSQKRAGFIVNETHRIRRVSWDKIMPPAADAGANITGMTLIENNEFLFILDLEKILIHLDIEAGFLKPMSMQDERLPNLGTGGANVAPMPVAPTGPHILIVDDSKLIVNNVKTYLMRQGYRVTDASDGREALQIIEQSAAAGATRPKVDLVVSDVEMPRMDGLTFTRAVRENPLLKHIPIILHTSLSGATNQEAGLSVGANGYVVKNDLNTLTELIREILGGTTPARNVA